jgi:hypothetical protein
VGRFTAYVKRIGRIVLHTKRQFKRLNPRVESLINSLSPVFCIQSSQQIQLPALRFCCDLGMFDVPNKPAQFLML